MTKFCLISTFQLKICFLGNFFIKLPSLNIKIFFFFQKLNWELKLNPRTSPETQKSLELTRKFKPEPITEYNLSGTKLLIRFHPKNSPFQTSHGVAARTRNNRNMSLKTKSQMQSSHQILGVIGRN